MKGAGTAARFKNGASRAVRLPMECRFEADQAFVARDDATGQHVLSTAPLPRPVARSSNTCEP